MDLIKKRVLILGSNGKLGQRVSRMLMEPGNYELFAASAEEKSEIENIEYESIDISKRNSVKSLFHKFFPDVVINAAGMTNVDLCETNKELCWNTNVKGTENIAMSSWAIDALLIHISSDYIFDGKEGPYSEEDIPHPISYYGRSKLAAENSLRTSGARYVILRTNVLYGRVKNNKPDFVSWVVENLSKGKEIRIVTDQINNPTFIDDLSEVILRCTEKSVEGIFNIGGPELLTRFDFCLRIADYFNLDKNLILPITTAELKQAAPRPLKSGLICGKAERELDFKSSGIEESFGVIKKYIS